jgi:DNA alkylation repair enzyme
MADVASIMADLRKKGTEKTRKIYARHGMVTDRMFGVSVADLKLIAKKIKGQQALACELYETGNLDAMYLAGMVADGSLMTKPELNAWAEGAANLQMIAEYTGFKGKGTDPSGKPLDENERWTDTWVKMPNGKWQCAASHASTVKM